MKLLMFQASRFCYKTFLKVLPNAEDQKAEEDLRDAAVVFIHAEAKDEVTRDKVLAKTLKNIKWLANKRQLKKVVLHSFNHLSTSKAEPQFAQQFMQELAERLRQSDYSVSVTPFGYTCAWTLSVYGESIAKVFKEI